MLTVRNRAFTVVELMIVVVVIGILAATTVVGYRGMQTRAADADVKNDARNISDSLELYYLKNKAFPSQLADMGEIKKSTNTSLTYESNGTSYCLNAFNTKPGVKSFTVRDDSSVAEGNCDGWVANAGDGGGATTPPPVTVSAPSGAWTLGYTVSTVKVDGYDNERYVITASGSVSCATGSLEWKLGVTGGASPSWSSVPWQSSNARTVDVPHTGIYSAFDVTIFAKARCVSGADFTEGSAKYVYRGSGGGAGGSI